MVTMCVRQMTVQMGNGHTHCATLHTYQIFPHSRATAAQPAAPGFTVECIQHPTRTWPPRVSLVSIPTCNGVLPGLPIGVFSTIAPQLTHKVVHGRSARNTCGGMRSSANGQAMMCLIFR